MDWNHPLIEGTGVLWQDGTRAAFLDAVDDGTLPREAFNRWLSQDYLFAKGLTAAQAVQTARTPRPAQSTLIAGLGAMDAEMTWFETHLAQRGIDLSLQVHPVCQRYTDYLISSAYTQPFEVLLAILYGVEVAYLAAWSSLEATGPYKEFITRWSNPAFVDYVAALGTHVLDHPHQDQQEQFNQVLIHERDFWSMTWEG